MSDHDDIVRRSRFLVDRFGGKPMGGDIISSASSTTILHFVPKRLY